MDQRVLVVEVVRGEYVLSHPAAYVRVGLVEGGLPLDDVVWVALHPQSQTILARARQAGVKGKDRTCNREVQAPDVLVI